MSESGFMPTYKEDIGLCEILFKGINNTQNNLFLRIRIR